MVTGTEESGHCREVAIVERLKQEWMYGLSAKTNGSCKEVADVERLKQYLVHGLSVKKKKMAVVEKWPLVAIV